MDGSKNQQSQFVLPEPPEDSISSVKFLPGSNNLLLASSWDGFLRIYNIQEKSCVCTSEENHPLLDCAASSDYAFYGGLDCAIHTMDLETQKCQKIGEHIDAVRSIHYSVSSRVVVTGSWDASVMVWDTRSLECVGNHPQVNEVFCMDVRDELVLVGTANKRVSIWDLRNMKSFLSERSSKLPAYQSRCVKIFPDKKRFALGTIEGRVSIDCIKEDDPSVSVYAFKPHVDKQDGVGHPVNSIGVHNPSSYFVTGASDKRVLLWDPDRKRRVSEFCSYPSSISAMDFSEDGTKLAIGCSYTHDLTSSPDPIPPVRIYVRNMKPESWGIKGSSISSDASQN